MTSAILLVIVCASNVRAMDSSNSPTSLSVCATSNLTKITVYEIAIGQFGDSETITRTLSGLYNPVDNTISIRGKIWPVQKNDYTGYGRENYGYQARGIYFFNL